jgi:vacuolar-type H+-ATPase subunit I/STV1
VFERRKVPMAQGNVKLFAITTVLFAVFGIIFFGLSITSIGKYQGQRQRVHHLEQKILAGKKEMLKVPEMIGKLRKADKTNKEFEVQVAGLTESNGELEEELTELQKELTTVTIAKAVLETDKAGYTKNLIEARQTVEELRAKLSTNDGGSRIDDISLEEELTIEIPHSESAEEASTYKHTEATSSALQNTLDSIQKILQSAQFMFLSPGERFEKLNSLITRAKEQSEAKPELNQLVNEFAEKLSSAESTLSEIFASLDEAQTRL